MKDLDFYLTEASKKRKAVEDPTDWEKMKDKKRRKKRGLKRGKDGKITRMTPKEKAAMHLEGAQQESNMTLDVYHNADGKIVPAVSKESVGSVKIKAHYSGNSMKVVSIESDEEKFKQNIGKNIWGSLSDTYKDSLK